MLREWPENVDTLVDLRPLVRELWALVSHLQQQVHDLETRVAAKGGKS